jgi:hypothetical protein
MNTCVLVSKRTVSIVWLCYTGKRHKNVRAKASTSPGLHWSSGVVGKWPRNVQSAQDKSKAQGTKNKGKASTCTVHSRTPYSTIPTDQPSCRYNLSVASRQDRSLGGREEVRGVVSGEVFEFLRRTKAGLIQGVSSLDYIQEV